MQGIVEELVRLVGYAILRVVSLGRYEGSAHTDRLSEGAVGLGVIVGFAYLIYGLLA